jgi:LacI family transcriptional regulator
MSENRVTLKDIAAAAGVSPATVSLSLRGDPRVARATVAKVQALAQKLGYQPDPHLSHLMGYLQKGRVRGEGSVIGVLTDFSEQELRDHAYMSLSLGGLEECCRQLGYKPTIFTLGKQMGLRRTQGILQARGIQGLVLMPFRDILFRLDKFDFSAFSAVAIGYGLQSPPLHRAASQQTLAAMRVVERVLANGYKRIGILLPQEIDQRTRHRYLAGFLGQMACQQNPSGAIPPLLFQSMDPAELRTWITRHRLQAIVSSYRELPETLDELGLEPGRDIALAMVDYQGQRQVAHMEVPYASLGRAAVNLVHGLLSINERGIPALPSVLTVPGVWVDGPTLPRRF